MAHAIYNIFKHQLISNEINLLTDDIKVILVSDYIVDIDNHEYLSDVKSNEISGVGYTSGGKSLSTKSLVRDNVNDRVRFVADALSWESSYLSASGIILYKNTDVEESSSLVCYIDFGAVKVSNNTSLRIEWSLHEGVFYII